MELQFGCIWFVEFLDGIAAMAWHFDDAERSAGLQRSSATLPLVVSLFNWIWAMITSLSWRLVACGLSWLIHGEQCGSPLRGSWGWLGWKQCWRQCCISNCEQWWLCLEWIMVCQCNGSQKEIWTQNWWQVCYGWCLCHWWGLLFHV